MDEDLIGGLSPATFIKAMEKGRVLPLHDLEPGDREVLEPHERLRFNAFYFGVYNEYDFAYHQHVAGPETLWETGAPGVLEKTAHNHAVHRAEHMRVHHAFLVVRLGRSRPCSLRSALLSRRGLRGAGRLRAFSRRRPRRGSRGLSLGLARSALLLAAGGFSLDCQTRASCQRRGSAGCEVSPQRKGAIMTR